MRKTSGALAEQDRGLIRVPRVLETFFASLSERRSSGLRIIVGRFVWLSDEQAFKQVLTKQSNLRHRHGVG